MKARHIISLAVLVSLSGFFLPPFVPHAEAIVATAAAIAADAAPSAGAAAGTVAAGIAPLPSPANAECVVTGNPCADALGAFGICLSPGVCVATAVVSLGALLLAGAMGGNSGSSGGGASYPMSLPGGSKAGCSGTPYISQTPSLDPCAVYILTAGTASSTLNLGNPFLPHVSSVLFNAVNSSSGTAGTPGVSSTLLNTAAGASSMNSASGVFPGSQSQSAANTPSYLSSISSLIQNIPSNNVAPSSLSASANTAATYLKPAGVQSGTRGDILASASGVTITAGTYGADGQTGTAGFFGADAVPGIQSQTLAKNMCTARPWASSANPIIPLSFFDNLCVERGYKNVSFSATSTSGTGTGVGTANKSSGTAGSGTLPAQTTDTAGTKTSLPPGPVFIVPVPSVAISAMPARIRVGARSSIYWSATGVMSCTESSPDGSFSGNTLSGAASTVALYGNTVFTITCVAYDGSSVLKSVTVQTSI